jgi:RimJ/RimL family protein N-acetyltransferase
MNYQLLTNPNDALISTILSVYKLPSIAQFISIDGTNYWNYVTSTKNVWFYKVYKENFLVSTIHLEICDRILFMDIIVFPEYQKKGIATKILKDIQNGKLGIDFDKIQVSIDEKNIASIKLFENAGFVCIAKDEELLDYLYIKN